MNSELSGRCRCGKVKWKTSEPVLWSGHCHCDSCRRATSSAFTSFFGVPRKSVEWFGDLTTQESSNGRVARMFCSSCGSQMTCQSTLWPDETHLYAATMDQPELFEPRAHFHFNEKLPWVHLGDDLPKYPGSADTTEPLI